MARRWGLGLLLALSIPSACNSLDDGDEEPGCFAGFKDCSGVCTRTTNPFMGCANPECSPCPIPNAIAGCDVDGACLLVECQAGFGNCNADDADGCEILLDTDPHNCGRCGMLCDNRANTQAVDCNDRECFISICAPGFEDADAEYENGCELEL